MHSIHSHSRFVRACALLCATLLLPVAAHTAEPSTAAEPPATAEPSAALVPVETLSKPDPWDLRLGAFLVTDANTDLRLGTTNGEHGTDLSFADNLGGETSVNVFRADVDWHFSGPHQFSASWYDIDLTGHRVIDRDIDWGDHHFSADADVRSKFRTQIYKFSYGYTFLRGERHEITALIGVHVMTLDTSLSVSGTATGNSGSVSGAAETGGFNITAPLPAFGVGWRARWTDRISTTAAFQYFGISLEDNKYSGHFTDFIVAGEYRVSRHWGLGAGYNRFELKADFKREPLVLSVIDKYNGFLIFVAAHF
jgi:hypothetical protein